MSDDSPGLACTKCGCRHLPVKYSRRVGTMMRRVRTCRNCGKDVTTHERAIDNAPEARD